MVLGGDVMLNGIAPKTKPLEGVAPPMKSADIALANLEIPLTKSRRATSLKTPAELKKRSQFILKADPAHAANVSALGVKLVSMASNHQMDYGFSGATECRLAVEKLGIGCAGVGKNTEEAFQPAIYRTSSGVRVGLLSALAFVGRGAIKKTGPAGEASPGIAALLFDGRIDDKAKTQLKRWIGLTRKQCDVVVVALHWGIERQTMPTPYQVNLGRTVINCGADVVWGHHPHVWQPMEIYRGKPILYSTGNLISPLPSRTGLVRLRYNTSGKVGVEFLPAACSGGETKLLSGNRAEGEKRSFEKLCAAFQRRYHDEHSKAP